MPRECLRLIFLRFREKVRSSAEANACGKYLLVSAKEYDQPSARMLATNDPCVQNWLSMWPAAGRVYIATMSPVSFVVG